MNKHLEGIMKKEMTRKEFLTMVGFGVASLFGLSTLLRLLTGKSNPLHKSTFGYGNGTYGGK